MSVDVLIGESDVEEKVFVVVFLVQRSHGGRRGWDHVVDEEEEGIFGSQMDALPDEEVELAHGEVRRHQVLLLVEVTETSSRGFLDDDWHAVWILASDLLPLGLALFERVLLFVYELHDAIELARELVEWKSEWKSVWS